MIDLKVQSPSIEPTTTSDKGKAVSNSKVGPAFFETVKDAKKKLLDGDLKDLISQVKAYGDRFFRSPDQNTLATFKSAIGEFLGRIKKELFSIKTEPGSVKDGQQKVYQLVETLDKDVVSLTQETLQKDKSLTLLAGLDDIRGLTIDLIT
ncbi:MAG: YaaR family protein [Candidatus Riflebacteria bacterium]|nr:YaaR family protein [Candidatus Riflebacteria bacterium]